jgi:uncharacterized membrane protein (UPF0127 family)
MQAREEFHKAARRRSARALATAFLVVYSGCAAEAEAPREAPGAVLAEAPPSVSQGPPAGHAWIIFGADTVLAEVAATADERAQGLMYRESVPDGTGMLFVFPDVSVRSFWMANTYVALDLAFLDAAFNVVDIVQMQPLVTETVSGRAPAMYGLEVRQGWLAENGIAIGARAQIVFGVTGRR